MFTYHQLIIGAIKNTMTKHLNAYFMRFIPSSWVLSAFQTGSVKRLNLWMQRPSYCGVWIATLENFKVREFSLPSLYDLNIRLYRNKFLQHLALKGTLEHILSKYYITILYNILSKTKKIMRNNRYRS